MCLCVCVGVSVCVCVCVCVCVYINKEVLHSLSIKQVLFEIYMCVFECEYVCKWNWSSPLPVHQTRLIWNVYVYMCVRVCARVCQYLCECKWTSEVSHPSPACIIYIYMYMYMYTYMHAYIRIYIHTARNSTPASSRTAGKCHDVTISHIGITSFKTPKP